ncbi:ornithine cyclodeaminase [Gemmobacter sp. 24YEA27]|uniref:ornithine cyclodeaminase family protein n=1 Tax=Gemmobacter sp. 24YEA27 TaxID=3040672 RepID=UPI0024B345DA|nr:ornithine cyclodeaminase [Gemmobacter sp. 24YEA27]
MSIRIITYDATRHLVAWDGVVEALRQGHLRAPADVQDLMLGGDGKALLNRAARIRGLGSAVKAETVFEANAAAGLPTVQGMVLLYDDSTGGIRAVIESRLVTRFKTVADSLLGAQMLAREDSRHLVILGAGEVAESLAQGYAATFPGLTRISIWARRHDQAQALAARLRDSPVPPRAVSDLAAALSEADIVASATLARAPILPGHLVRPGTHIDLIGAFTPEMREADDALIAKSRIYVDNFTTTIERIGELTDPIRNGVIARADVLGDLYSMVPAGPRHRGSDTEITLFKNGGGAHLDLMVADYIARITG